jgi:hypothetical protein
MDVNFESSKEIFNALEDIDEDILACFDVLRRLRTHVTRSARIGKRKHLPRGERQHQRKSLGPEGKPVERVSVRDPNFPRYQLTRTRLTPWLSVSEKA